MKDFHEGKDALPVDNLPCLNEHDLSTEVFEKMNQTHKSTHR